MELIDTHAHLYDEQYDNDLAATVERSRQGGVTAIYMPNLDRESVQPMLAVASQYPECKPMLGLHPCSVRENFEEELAFMRPLLDQHTFHAIGEVGIDLYRERRYHDEQRRAFDIQISWALAYNLPLVIHTRASLPEVLDILTAWHARNAAQGGQGGAQLRGIFHCFSGTLAQAEEAIALGFLLGIGGVVTFPKNNLAEIVKKVPLNSLVLETDGPYLAPVPYRGTRNESAYLLVIAQCIADIRGITLEEVAEATTENAKSCLF